MQVASSIDAVDALADVAGSWKPDGAWPWVWARHRVRAVVHDHVGTFASALDEEHLSIEAQAPVERIEDPRAVLRRAESKPGAPTPGEPSKSEALVRGKLALDPQRHECTWDGRPVRLTVTEFLILQALAQRPGFVKSRDSLMDAAYDDQVYVDDRTIDSHIKRLRKKFKAADNDFDMIETLYGVGYRFKEM